MLAVLLLLAVPARQALAAGAERQSEQIEQFSRMMTSLEGEDETHRATAELGKLRNSLLEARMLLRDDRPHDLERLLKTLTPEVQLIRTLVDLGLAERRAATQRSEAEALEEKVRKLEREKGLLEARVTLLESQARSRAAAPRAGIDGPGAFAAPFGQPGAPAASVSAPVPAVREATPSPAPDSAATPAPADAGSPTPAPGPTAP